MFHTENYLNISECGFILKISFWKSHYEDPTVQSDFFGHLVRKLQAFFLRWNGCHAFQKGPTAGEKVGLHAAATFAELYLVLWYSRVLWFYITGILEYWNAKNYTPSGARARLQLLCCQERYSEVFSSFDSAFHSSRARTPNKITT